MKRLMLVLALTGSITLACGPRVVYVPVAPPPPRHEVVPPKPHPRALWIPGHWKWVRGRYVWVPGHWEMHPRGKRWVPGHWEKTPRGWRWVPGHWER